jgi:membrane associated rhomboid family serine protease
VAGDTQLDLTLGVHPRDPIGLAQIFSQELCHVSFTHVGTNTLGVLIVSFPLYLVYGWKEFWSVTLFVVIVGGFIEWCIARSQYVYCGASEFLFGQMFFCAIVPCLARPWSWKMVVLSLLVLGVYGSAYVCGFACVAIRLRRAHLYAADQLSCSYQVALVTLQSRGRVIWVAPSRASFTLSLGLCACGA